MDLQSNAFSLLATRARVFSHFKFQIGAEREIRTLEARLEVSHVSSYIIPARHCRFLIADCRFLPGNRAQLAIGNRKSPLSLVREDRIELSPRVSRTRMLALHHARKKG